MDIIERWRDEALSAWLYGVLAEAEEEPRQRALFGQLQKAAEHQAGLIAAEAASQGTKLPPLVPPPRVRLVAGLARRFGPRSVRSLLPALKIRGLSAWTPLPAAVGHLLPTRVEDVGRRHRGASGGTLRAAEIGRAHV